MPRYNVDKEKLMALLREHNIPVTDAVKRGKFYESYFDWKAIATAYEEGKYSIIGICKKYNLSYDVVRVNLLKQLGSLHENRNTSKYTLYENLFKPMSTVGAYFMGWLYSDGYIVSHTKLGIGLGIKDKEHLAYLTSLVCDKPVIVKQTTVDFSFYSSSFTDFLQQTLNVQPNKSHIDFEIPLGVYEDTLPYLLLGLLEGDGSICATHLGCSLLLTKSTWNALSPKLFNLGIQSSTVQSLNDFGLLQITFTGNNYFNLLGFIYANTSEVKPLKRKSDLFLRQLQRSINGRTSPYKKAAVNIRDSLNGILI